MSKSEDQIAYERLLPTLHESMAARHIGHYAIHRETRTLEVWPVQGKELTGVVTITIDGVTKRASEWANEFRDGLASEEFRNELKKYVGPEDTEWKGVSQATIPVVGADELGEYGRYLPCSSTSKGSGDE